MKKILLAIICLNIYLIVFSQEAGRPLHSVSIYKTKNNDGKQSSIYLLIDSTGKIYLNNKRTRFFLGIKDFTEAINKCVRIENFVRHPGNNNISITEAPVAKLNMQHIIVSVVFSDDFILEQKLENKTYYSWGRSYDKDNTSYPLFHYLNEREVSTLKSFLE